MTSLLTFKQLDPTKGYEALPYALTIEQQTGEIEPRITAILDVFRQLTTGYRGLLEFNPSDAEGLDVSLYATDTTDGTTMVGKWVTYGDTPDTSSEEHFQDRDLTHNYHEFARWLTEYYNLVQDEDYLGGTLTLDIYDSADQHMTDSLLTIEWWISSEGIELLHQHRPARH